MATILITGGTGLIGSALTGKLLEKGHEVIILSRKENKNIQTGGNQSLTCAQWNIKDQTIDMNALKKADYIIHLAGAGVAAKRWTRKRKNEIVNSRVQSSRLLANGLMSIENKVKAVVCASAIGWYGTDKDGKSFKESDPPAPDFLGETCRLWEDSVDRIADSGTRVVKLRTGIVLSNKGGALREFLRPLDFGVAAIPGDGRQVLSWIHIDDLVNIYINAITNESMQGVYNAVAPEPVSNKVFVLELARSRRKRFIVVRVPSFVLKMIMGEMSVDVLKSVTVNSDKIQSTGFRFKFGSISLALKDLIRIS